MKKFRFDSFLLLAVLCISVFGIIMIYSASSIWAEYKFHDPFKFVKAQGVFFLAGMVLLFVLSRTDYHIYEKKANLILGIFLF